MTEYEFLTAIADRFGFAVQAAMAFFTVFGAYVVTAYLAGKSFSKLVAISLSTLYSLFLTGPLAGIFLNVYEMHRLEGLYFTLYPGGEIVVKGASPEFAIVAITGPLVLGWILSLLYMHVHVRGGP